MSDTTEFPCPYCGDPISLSPNAFGSSNSPYRCSTCSRRSYLPRPVRLYGRLVTYFVVGAGVAATKWLKLWETETPFDFVVLIAAILAIIFAGVYATREFNRRNTTHLEKR